MKLFEYELFLFAWRNHHRIEWVFADGTGLQRYSEPGRYAKLAISYSF